ncbi:MAG: hypothetical protein ABIU58_10950 [Ramlibacter sp.]
MADGASGSAWSSAPDYGQVLGTDEFYGNSGCPTVQQGQPYAYGNRAYLP